MYPVQVLERTRSSARVGSLPGSEPGVGTGTIRSPQGNTVRVQVRVGAASGIIEEARFKTFGCGWAIASASLAAELIEGRSIGRALEISSREICAALELPEAQRHCADSAEQAVRLAIADYLAHREQRLPRECSAG